MALQVPGFDPDALEQAAAQFRPAWDDGGDPERLSSDLIAAEFESQAAAPASSLEPPFVVRGTGEIDVAPGEVIVPRPPRTPQLDYSGMRTHDGDDLGMALPKRSLKGLWITIAVFLGAATFAFALTRGMDNKKADGADRIEAAPIAPTAPTAEESAKPTPPQPPPRVEAVEAPAPTPSPAAQLAPEPAPQEPAPVAAPVETVAKRPAPSAPVRARTEKSARASRVKRSTTEPRAPAPATHTSTPKKSKRGAGFVSTNPY